MAVGATLGTATKPAAMIAGMRSLVYFVACTVDGFIADVKGSVEPFAFEGPQVPDLLEEFPEMLPGHLRAHFGVDAPNRRFDTILMGRATYEPGPAAGITSPYPHLRQILVSASTVESPDPAIEVVRAGVADRVRALKAESGADIWLCGGGVLAASLIDEIDEVILKISPMLLGTGIPLFAGELGTRDLDVIGHRTYGNGFALMRARPRRRSS